MVSPIRDMMTKKKWSEKKCQGRSVFEARNIVRGFFVMQVGAGKALRLDFLKLSAKLERTEQVVNDPCLAQGTAQALLLATAATFRCSSLHCPLARLAALPAPVCT